MHTQDLLCRHAFVGVERRFFLLVCASVFTNTCMSCPDIQSHMDAPVPDFVQRRGSNSVQSALPAAFHARHVRAAEKSRLCYFHLSGILPAHWPAPVTAARHLCGAMTHTHTHSTARTSINKPGHITVVTWLKTDGVKRFISSSSVSALA